MGGPEINALWRDNQPGGAADMGGQVAHPTAHLEQPEASRGDAQAAALKV
jgi:hypothetical protein